MTDRDVLVDVVGLKKYYPIKGGFLFDRQVGAVRAVDDVSFQIYRGETLGLVGESGSGKTTVGRTLLRLEEPTGGSIRIGGEDFLAMKGEALRRMRQRLQMIFQDPYASLNPRMKVEALISEPLELQGELDRASIRERVLELLDLVALPRRFRDRYPHEFSGGQRQRIGIARALTLRPDLIVCDESIASLDVSIQAQIINLLEDLQANLGLTFLFIAHDLRMVHHISSRIAVMYLGKIMELASKDSIQREPLHPYTRALISAIPVPDPKIEQESGQIVLEGDIPSPADPPAGCVFSTRCPLATDICRQSRPDLRELRPSHHVACHLA